MLGDTSMGMINGYFGPRLLYPIGFSEHKVDQAWLIDRTRTIDGQPSRRCVPVCPGPWRYLSLGEKPMPRTSRPRPPASNCGATWLSSICWTNSRPIAWAGSTSSAS